MASVRAVRQRPRRCGAVPLGPLALFAGFQAASGSAATASAACSVVANPVKIARERRGRPVLTACLPMEAELAAPGR